MMFLVVDPQSRSYIFTEKDPRTEGFTGSVERGVRLEDTWTLNERSEHATTAVPAVRRRLADPEAPVRHAANITFEKINGKKNNSKIQ